MKKHLNGEILTRRKERLEKHDLETEREMRTWVGVLSGRLMKSSGRPLHLSRISLV